MKIQHIIPLLLLAGGINVGAQTTNTIPTTAKPMIEQIKTHIHDLQASPGAQLSIRDSSATVTSLVTTAGKASAEVIFAKDGGKSDYQLQLDFALKDQAATTKRFADAGFKVPSTWTIQDFSSEDYIQFSLPATPEDEQKLVDFIHIVFTKICNVPESDKLKFGK